MKKIPFFLIAVGLILFYPSCKENTGSEIDYNPNVLSSKDFVRGEDEIFEIVNSFYKGVYDSLVNQNGYNFIDNCDVSYRPAQNALIFGYGNVDRMCADGKFRRGNISATFSGEIFVPNVTAHIETHDLFIDDKAIYVVADLENLGLNGQNLTEFSLVVDTSNIMLPDTTKVTGVKIKLDYLMVWQEGYNTPTHHEDDMFLVTGTASGISTDNYKFSLSIQQPFEDWLDCFWLDNGTSQITVPVASVPTGEIVKEDTCSNLYYYHFNENTFFDAIK
jgi:hypothetical protein